MRRSWVPLLLALVVAAVSLGVVPPPAHAHEPGLVDGVDVAVYDYDLGDRAMRVGGFHSLTRQGVPSKRLAPIEVTGRAYVPAGAAGRRLPVVVIAHGLFWTCADTRTGRVDQSWPCRGRFEPIASERGYDYLGRSLAARGMLVVSVSADGVNAGELGEVADRARAAVVFRHLRLWRALVEHDRGALKGALHDATTGRRVDPALRGAGDLRNVGLLGHSRGGRGAMWAAARENRDRVPHGVRIRAVFGLAAPRPPFLDRDFERVQVTDVPLMTWSGTCDSVGRDEYNRLARRGGNPVNIAMTVHGANHNNLNTRWARGGGPGGEDDATHPPGRPGRCHSYLPDEETTKNLRPRPERRVAATYVTAFFARFLLGDRSHRALLDGRREPLAGVARVDVRRY